MTKEEIFNYFYTNTASIGLKHMLLVFFGGLIIGAVIYCTYKITKKGVEYNEKFNISLVAILEISILIMLMISSNIVISLGMVGALSIVRFRTAIKDSRDTVFIFWAIAEGLSVGSLNFKLASISTLFIAIFLSAVTLIPSVKRKYILVVLTEQNVEIMKIKEIINPYVKDIRFRTINENKNQQEMIFEICVKNEINPAIINKLSSLHGIKSVNCISESGETFG